MFPITKKKNVSSICREHETNNESFAHVFEPLNQLPYWVKLNTIQAFCILHIEIVQR